MIKDGQKDVRVGGVMAISSSVHPLLMIDIELRRFHNVRYIIQTQLARMVRTAGEPASRVKMDEPDVAHSNPSESVAGLTRPAAF